MVKGFVVSDPEFEVEDGCVTRVRESAGEASGFDA